jgi:hypothetical protein
MKFDANGLVVDLTDLEIDMNAAEDDPGVGSNGRAPRNEANYQKEQRWSALYLRTHPAPRTKMKGGMNLQNYFFEVHSLS